MNQLIKISVSYNSNEILIELDDSDFDIFDTFIKILAEKTGEQNILNNFELMPVNTSMPYILIDENNFSNIIYEKISDEYIKIFMNKKEKNEEEEENDIINNNENINKNKIKEDDDDFSDHEDDNIQEENTKETINIKQKGKDNEIELKNEIKDENKIESDNFKNIKNEIIINEESDDIFEKDNININNLKENNETKEKKIMRKKIIAEDLFLKKEKNEKEENIFENEFCSKCNSPLLSKKSICIICSNIILCSNCELYHDHPCIIFKSNFISTLKDVYNFMNKQYNSSSNISKKTKKVILGLSFIGDKDIFLRPNKGTLLPIQINNNSDITIFSSDIMILIKGNKFLEISYDSYTKYKIPPNKSKVVHLKCVTMDKLCKENITIEIFSNRYILKENKNLKINLNIEVNNDKVEEDLNIKLNYNEMVIFYNKEHKEILVSLLENELKGYNPEQIVEILRKNNWNKEKCMKNVLGK